MRGKARCRLHGGKSTGPKTFEGLARIRQANTKTGKWSAVALAVSRRERQWFWNGYRSLRALERLGVRLRRASSDGAPHPLAELARQDWEGLDAAIVAEFRREAEQAVADADYLRLRAKGFVPLDPERDAHLAAQRVRRPLSSTAAAAREARDQRESMRRFRATLRQFGL
jgi:hypothetical protein